VQTRAALFHAPGEPFEIALIDLDDPREDEVVVRMSAAHAFSSPSRERARRRRRVH
jgi:Zn-dependent alcohol dehydrogenase